jgi:hypothetical protein
MLVRFDFDRCLEVAVFGDDDDSDGEYGEWEFTLAGELEAERKRNPVTPPEDIWPRWNQGVPTMMRRTGLSPAFYNKGVRHGPRLVTVTMTLSWNSPYRFTELRNDYRLLPGTHQSQWAGVYRIFVEGQAIDRLLGKDPTGTLYVGMAGAGPQNWSIMRNRLMSAAKRDHHVASRWSSNEALAAQFPWETVSVQWAFTAARTNYKGEDESGARMAEIYLLWCYRDCFGELPPFNEKR